MFKLKGRVDTSIMIKDTTGLAQLLWEIESPVYCRGGYIENTDYIEFTQIQDWTLGYWIEPRCELMGLCLGERELKKLLRFLEFSPLEDVVKQIIGRKNIKCNILDFKTQIIKDPDTDADVLLVDVLVKERDFEKVLELWKKISTEIRNEIDKRFGEKSEDFQRRLLIRVQPAK